MSPDQQPNQDQPQSPQDTPATQSSQQTVGAVGGSMPATTPPVTPSRKKLVLILSIVGVVAVLLVVVIVVAFAMQHGSADSQTKKVAPTQQSVALSDYTQSTPSKQQPSAKTYRDLMSASHASIANQSGSQTSSLGEYKGYSISGFDLAGKHGDKHARFGEFVTDSVSLCLSDFQQNISIEILYDGNPRWNGNNALVLFLNDTNCHFDKNYAQITAALWLDLNKDGSSIDYTGATPGNNEPVKTLTSIQQALVDELKATHLDENIAAHWIGSF